MAQPFYRSGLVTMGFAAVYLGLMYRHGYGRTYQLFLEWLQSQWIKRVRKGVLWESRNHDGPKQRKFYGSSPPIPHSIHHLPGVGLLYNVLVKCDSVVIQARGSNIASVSLKDQYGAVVRAAEWIKQTAAIAGFRIGISFVSRRRPKNVFPMVDWLTENLHPEVVYPSAERLPEAEQTPRHKRYAALHENTKQLVGAAKQQTAETTQAVVLTIQRDPALAELFSGKRALVDNKADQLQVLELIAQAVNGLDSWGVEDPHALNPDELYTYLREAWDTTTLDNHRDASADDDYRPLEDGWWPQRRIFVGKDYCQTDDTLHAVIRITGVREWNHANSVRPLFNPDVRRVSVAVIGEAIKSENEVRFWDRLIPMGHSFDEARGVIYKSQKKTDREEKRAERQHTAYQSGITSNNVILVAVSADTKEELERDVRKVLIHLTVLGMKGKRVTGESRIFPTLWSAVTGASLL